MATPYETHLTSSMKRSTGMLPPHTTQHVHTHTNGSRQMGTNCCWNGNKCINTDREEFKSAVVSLFTHTLARQHPSNAALSGEHLTEMVSSREDSHTRGNADTTLEALQFPPPRASLPRNTHTTHVHTQIVHTLTDTHHTHTLTMFRHLSRSIGAPTMWSGGDNSLSCSYLPPSLLPPPLAHHSLSLQVCSPSLAR